MVTSNNSNQISISYQSIGNWVNHPVVLLSVAVNTQYHKRISNTEVCDGRNCTIGNPTYVSANEFDNAAVVINTAAITNDSSAIAIYNSAIENDSCAIKSDQSATTNYQPASVFDHTACCNYYSAIEFHHSIIEFHHSAIEFDNFAIENDDSANANYVSARIIHQTAYQNSINLKTLK